MKDSIPEVQLKPILPPQTVSFFSHRNLKGVTTRTWEQGMDQDAGKTTSVLKVPYRRKGKIKLRKNAQLNMFLWETVQCGYWSHTGWCFFWRFIGFGKSLADSIIPKGITFTCGNSAAVATASPGLSLALPQLAPPESSLADCPLSPIWVASPTLLPSALLKSLCLSPRYLLVPDSNTALFPVSCWGAEMWLSGRVFV